MASFVSQFGAASLAVQEELRRSVDRSAPVPNAANFVILTLDRTTFVAEHGNADRDSVERFRNDLRREIEVFVASNEWEMREPLSLNILLRSIPTPCHVRVERRRSFYSLRIRDDAGERVVPVKWPTVVLGREHEAPSRAFVPVRDGSRALSREHMVLTFRDLELSAVLVGANPTTYNGEPMRREEETPLHAGDVLRCGAHTIEVIAEP